MNDQHLTQEQRYQIYVLSKTRMTQKEIADILGKLPSSISRELKRNKGKKGYRPKQAHHLATTRKSSNAKQINKEVSYTITSVVVRRKKALCSE